MEVDNLEKEKSQKKSVNYPGFWPNIITFLYLGLAGFTCYSTLVIYEDFVDKNDPKAAQQTLEDTTVIYFSLMIAIVINSIICSYLFFIKEIDNYKILLFNCILGLSSFIVFSPYIIALREDADNSVIFPLVSASVGLFLSGIVTVKALWPKENQY